MPVTYKDINQLSQKQTLSGTEKIPVSDTEYITPAQITMDVPKAAWFDSTDATMYWFASDADKASFIADKTQTSLPLFSAVINIHGSLQRIEATYTQTKTLYITSSLDEIKSDLVVEAFYADGYSEPVTTYSLSGNLTVGTSTITVTYETSYTTTVSVTVSERWEYKFSEGSLTKMECSTSWQNNTDKNLFLSTAHDNTRRSFVILAGERSFRYTTNNSTFDQTSDYFPIPIPSTATKVTMSITPNTQYFGPSFYTLSNGNYTRTLDSGWQLGSKAVTFNAGQYAYLSINCKMASNGSTKYTVEPTEFIISFE